MPRTPRTPPSSPALLLVVLASLLASVLAFPALVVGCAQGDPQAAGIAAVEPTKAQLPTEPPPPPAPAPTQEKPKPPANPDDALAPEVTSVTPDKGTVGAVGPSIVVSGMNFVSRSIVQLDGTPLATNFVSGTELRATIPTSKLAAVGVLRLSVGTSPPGGGASKEVTFEVQNPGAILTSLSPLSAVAGSGATTIEAGGTGFVPGATIVFGGTDLVTTFGSSTSLEATIPTSLLVSSGSVPVKVVNPPPGGGSSSAISFTVTNPTASIQLINPSAAFVGSAPFQMTVNGSGFLSGSSVIFNGGPLVTTFISPTQLRANVTAASLNAAGDFPVAVSNPPPGGGVTAPLVFRVQYPAPSASSLSPSMGAAGTGPTDIVVTGIGFFVTSQITFDGAPTATAYQDATHLKGTVTAAQLAIAGSISVRVVNPTPGGGTSTALAFTMTNGVPSMATIAPEVVAAGSPDISLTIWGNGFVPTSTVKGNGVLIASTYTSGTMLNAIVPSNYFLNPGSVAITVTNPAPGGGTSNTRYMTVGCDTSGVDVALGAVGNLTTLPTNFAAAPLMSRFTDSGSCAATSLTPANQQPGRYWVVQNTAGAPVTLSAWAVCTASGVQDDAYLTFYRRPTKPANDTERLACAYQIAEGIAVSNYTSPESGVSNWCPGLTKANGGGLTLGVCEKAVVHVQPYNYLSVSYPPPPTIRLKPE